MGCVVTSKLLDVNFAYIELLSERNKQVITTLYDVSVDFDVILFSFKVIYTWQNIRDILSAVCVEILIGKKFNVRAGLPDFGPGNIWGIQTDLSPSPEFDFGIFSSCKNIF